MKGVPPTKVFISYASEDRDFVEPLAEALNEEFSIFYDRISLNWGDSLRQVIGQALVDCDYGIVVMSRAFFSKEWPQSELDALQALEQENRKMILPIWKDLEFKDVRQKVPFLANRLAMDSKLGTVAIVKALRQVVFTRDQTSAFKEPLTPREKLLANDKKAHARSQAKSLLNSRQGGELVSKSSNSILEYLKAEIAGMADARLIKITYEQRHDGLEINAPGRLRMHIPVSYNGSFNATFFRRRDDWGEDDGGVIKRFEFEPDIDDSQQVVWLQSGQSHSPSQVGTVLLNAVIDKAVSEVEKRHNRR